MHRILALALLSAAAVLGSPGSAGAELVAPASKLARESALPVATGPGGRALAIVPNVSCGDCDDGYVGERDASGRWKLLPITAPGMFATQVAWGPGGAATVFAIANTGTGGADAFLLRRPAGAAVFGEPAPVALGGPIYDNVQWASDAQGDLAFVTAVKGPDDKVRPVLVTAAPGAPFGPPQPLAGFSENAAVDVAAGRVLVAYVAGGGVYARSGKIGAPLGPPQRLTAQRTLGLSAALDDAGTATVALILTRTAVVDRYPLLVTRARRGGRFAPPVRLSPDTGTVLRAAAAGTTTALVWQRPYSDDMRVHVAIARGTARFDVPEAPSAPGLGRMGAHGQPYRPVVAVSDAGDTLLAYGYDFDGAMHATLRRAGSPRFGPLHLISKLGEGGAPSVAFLSDRRPLVAYHGRRGELLASTRLTGPRPDLTRPGVSIAFERDGASTLRATSSLTVTVRCSQACVLRTRATLRKLRRQGDRDRRVAQDATSRPGIHGALRLRHDAADGEGTRSRDGPRAERLRRRARARQGAAVLTRRAARTGPRADPDRRRGTASGPSLQIRSPLDRPLITDHRPARRTAGPAVAGRRCHAASSEPYVAEPHRGSCVLADGASSRPGANGLTGRTTTR